MTNSNVSSAGEMLADARQKLSAARDREWEDATPENRRVVVFWEEEVDRYAGMDPHDPIPLF